ncbi:hypothetical protein BN8_03602 [Fibrisoma limi BUZ 3]|uniref:DUF4180 domain-containing protein n=1 Tax=Fibrisoma limi BUZ 3 TaxID=1185876 RepID=I2GKL0_9BACT|nr:DUF4180 domain-containing protein [Fibrisoma limi]CCH54436.1 hypothetical protein BN8_03602 [Fibrisoma limi BUZ 3]
MEIKTHHVNGLQLAEIVATGIVIKTAEDGLDLLGTVYYQGFDRVILHQLNITPDFFNLRSGMAGEILQKFSNYRVRLAIVGDFSPYSSKSFNDFMFESNKAGHINFVGSLAEAVNRLATP